MHLTPVEVTSYKSKSFCNRKNKFTKKNCCQFKIMRTEMHKKSKKKIITDNMALEN